MILIAEEENYIKKAELVKEREQIIKCITILNGYINYLKKAKASTNNQ